MKKAIERFFGTIGLKKPGKRRDSGARDPWTEPSNAVLMVDVSPSRKDKGTVQGMDVLIRKGAFVVLVGKDEKTRKSFLELCSGIRIPGKGRMELFSGKVLPGTPTAREKAVLVPNVLPKREGKGLQAVLLRHAMLVGMDPGKGTGRIKKLALDLGMEKSLFKSMDELSLLEQRLAGLCLALLREPGLLCFHEPFEGLGPREKKILLDHIHALNQEGMTVILSCADPGEELDLADEILAAEGGRLGLKPREEVAEAAGKLKEMCIRVNPYPRIIPPELAVFKPTIRSNTIFVTLAEPSTQAGQVLSAVVQAGLSVEEIHFEGVPDD